MKDPAPQPIFLKDYRQPDFWIPEISLHFALFEDKAIVRSRLSVSRNTSAAADAPLVLAGEQLKLLSVVLDGKTLSAGDYTVTPHELTLKNPGAKFTLDIEVEIEPQNNLACEGLYKTSGMFCTQCEAESFRRITYFLDRPDAMSVFTVTVEADKTKYPILLSNGNPTSRRDLPDEGHDGQNSGRHSVTWHDPFKKPCYLFALVAGDLGVLEDQFVTRSGRKVKLQIFARHGQQERCEFAMRALKNSMKWDEDVYGLEYDLDIFMIVASDDFNMGAMENKGLNVFNASYVLANSKTATDDDFDNVEAVVAHEYFHNWTGNRVTCRDWFQLSLKEGLTVFRDQRFSADMGSEAVNRIEEVVRLRTHQFAEDAGPMAHPIRPHSYISINNFYTVTVYEKGAEVIRMIQTILGKDGFRKGMDLYFKRHDGQAVTTEDFVSAMADANKIDLTQFKNWYDQAGTPTLKVETAYDAGSKRFTITFEQLNSPSPGQNEKKPYHIPVAVGLLDSVTGEELTPFGGTDKTVVLHVREAKQSFHFDGIEQKPVLSLLRGFSAPVRTEIQTSDDELAFLMANDTDEYARWEASQLLTVRVTKELVADFESGHRLRDPIRLVAAFGPLLADRDLDPAFVAVMLTLPAETYLSQFFKTYNVDAIYAAREHIMRALSETYHEKFHQIFKELSAQEALKPGAHDGAGARFLKNRVLEYLTVADSPVALELAFQQASTAANMTDELGALHALNRTSTQIRKQALDQFHAKWKDEALVMNKWLGIQAVSPAPETFAEVKRLSQSDVFDKNNPNKIYALYVAFAKNNQVRFHESGGEAYRFIADQVLDIDTRNPQVAARLMGAFNNWRVFDENRQELMKAELSRIIATPGLSPNVFEIASKTLKG